MEQFNSKIYGKYKNLKRRRLFEDDEWIRQRESEIKDYQTATEDSIEDLKNENEKLRAHIDSLQEKFSNSQKLLLEESQKTKELSNEVGRLQNLLVEKTDNGNSASPISPYTSPRVRSRDTYKASPRKKSASACIIQSEVQNEEATIIPCDNNPVVEILPDCCRSNMTSSGDALGKSQKTCAFQTLMEFLVSMKLSLQCEADGLRVSFVHQRSGYTFTLTWIRHEVEGDGQLMYRVSSLGTLERVAVGWMKEDMVFSMAMCPVFFDRISRVVGRS